MKKNVLFYTMCLALLTMSWLGTAQAAVKINIYGPGTSAINLALATPISGPNTAAGGLAPNLHELVLKNINILPFVELTKESAILGGTLMEGYEPPNFDIKRYQIAGSDIVVSTYWPSADTVQMRAFETASGQVLFGKEYPNIGQGQLQEVADLFCADLLEKLIGSGDLFRSRIAFINKLGNLRSDVWSVRPNGTGLQQISNLGGQALSPAWSTDGRFVVFTHIDGKSHGLGVWDKNSGGVQRIRFPGNIVIGPAFTPSNQVAVSLSNGPNPDIFLLNHSFQRQSALEENNSINVSPSFDRSGTKMAFTSNRLGGPQIFLKDLNSGSVRRVSVNGTYNSEASLSPDGTMVAYSRMTDFGHRIFVQDLSSGQEKQITFGPGSDEHPAFCGDSYSIAFASTRGGGRGIYLTTRNGASPKRISTGGGDSSFPRWGISK